ncbi:MAG TPA: type 1 periplasmic binding fold superfamily protein [Flavobacteriales bacterium]|nr:type 1 periplasmic binding fold superfamily protein [Flavobacteriales bacterium]
MNKRMKQLAYALIATAMITACKKDDEDPVTPTTPPVNEEELITTLRLHFHSMGGSEHKMFVFTDLDGDGGNAPVITADTLSVDTMYHVEIEVLNESESPADTITTEIEEEGDVHQFFYQVSGANATVAYADTDANGLPIGLETMWTIGAASNGTVLVTLRHEPDKTAVGVSSGDISNAGGETDIAVSFPVVIE